MALWGKTEAAGAKPKWLTAAGKRDIFANTSGWVQPAQGISAARALLAQKEVLVAIGGLSSTVTSTDGPTGLGQATLTSINWNDQSYDKSEGGTIDVTLNFDEEVVVTGLPLINVSGTGGRNHNCAYVSGSGTNRLRMTKVIAAANAAWNAGDTLNIEANKVSQNAGSTIVDKIGGGNAIITHAAVTDTAAVVA